MNNRLAGSFLFFTLFLATQAYANLALSNPTIQPALQWKYGWQDGNRANTIGSARNNDPVPAASGVPSTGYLPSQIAHAYGFDLIPSTGDGRGQTIAIIIAYGSPNIQKDLNTFCTQYGLPSTTVTIAYSGATPTTVNSSWASEATLDVEWAHAMAPGASIVLVVAADSSAGNLLGAINYATGILHANVVSMSWGANEFSGCTYYDSYFNKPGTNFVASSGDNGAGVSWPACSPYVFSIGGTSLLYNVATGIVSAETAWAGSGGGVSLYETLPSYQSGWTSSTTNRSVPDASFVADPYTGVSVYFTDPTTNVGGWTVFGGTSVGAPQWAALLARRASLGNGLSTVFHTLFYGSAAISYATYLDDIISGSNGYPAKVGYDLVTGLGSPIANQVAAIPTDLKTPTPTPTARPTATPTPSPTARPTATPTPSPTTRPTATPTPSPTARPTATPTPSPTARPTATPTPTPTARPTATPTPSPTARPTATPTPTPTARPTATPTPTVKPTSPPITLPGTPAALVYSGRTSTGFKLTTPSPTSGATSIMLLYSANGTTGWVPIISTQFTTPMQFTFSAPKQFFYFRVRALNAMGSTDGPITVASPAGTTATFTASGSSPDKQGLFYGLGTNFNTSSWVNPNLSGALNLQLYSGSVGITPTSGTLSDLVETTVKTITTTKSAVTICFDLGQSGGTSRTMTTPTLRAWLPSATTSRAIYASPDGVNWTLVKTETNALGAGVWWTPTASSPAGARYWSVNTNGTNLGAAYVEFYGTVTNY